MEGIPQTVQEQQSLKKLIVNQNYDRISSLPDAILHYIFSFLPTKDVVRTCIVSKSWKNLLISLPYVHFIEHRQRNKQRFINFVNDFLRHHDDSSILEFRLFCLCACESSNVDEWISTAIKNKVEKLEVCIGYVKIHSLPSCLFTSDSLVELKLDFEKITGTRFRFPENFSFPKMKSMNLQCIIVAKSFTDQLHNSPYLEKLCLSVILDINSSQSSHQIEGIFPNLKEAIINFLILTEHLKFLESISSNFGVLKFLKKLSNVKDLSISYPILQILQFEKQLSVVLPTFCNLKNLELKFDGRGRDFDVLYYLLVHCPVLQSLDIIFCFGTCTAYRQQFYPLNLPQSLELVRIQEFVGKDHQVELVNNFFTNKDLKKIIVQVIKHRPAPTRVLRQLRRNLRRQLLSLPRPTLNCVYVIE